MFTTWKGFRKVAKAKEMEWDSPENGMDAEGAAALLRHPGIRIP